MTDSDLGIVGAADFERLSPELLDRVVGGEEITITRHGEPVARLVPAGRRSTPETRRNTIEQLRVLASCNSLAGLQVADLIAEGRK